MYMTTLKNTKLIECHTFLMVFGLMSGAVTFASRHISDLQVVYPLLD